MKWRARTAGSPPPRMADITVVLARLDAVVDRLEGVYGQMRLEKDRRPEQEEPNDHPDE